ncbi:MAG TPA: YggS family pyridoxal phosphate-dependent enzyme [Acidimicrobiia bacterium]
MTGPDVADAVREVRGRIAAAAARAGRDASAVTLVAATKTVDAARVNDVVAAGVVDVGENRAQELLAKAPLVRGARWHFVGALQRNKVRALAPFVACYQTVDREPLGAEIARRAPHASVLVEVNLAGEPQKAGCAPATAPALVDALRALHLDVRGLMAVPPSADDPRRWFAALRELGELMALPELSMGMTDDFEVAVEEGATIVRVGRALFGARPPTARGR